MWQKLPLQAAEVFLVKPWVKGMETPCSLRSGVTSSSANSLFVPSVAALDGCSAFAPLIGGFCGFSGGAICGCLRVSCCPSVAHGAE